VHQCLDHRSIRVAIKTMSTPFTAALARSLHGHKARQTKSD